MKVKTERQKKLILIDAIDDDFRVFTQKKNRER